MLQKLTVIQLVKSSIGFEGLLLCLQDPTARFYSEPAESSPHPHNP